MLTFLEILHVTSPTGPYHPPFSDAFRRRQRPAPASEGHLPTERDFSSGPMRRNCAVISGAGGWTSIALYGEKQLEFLRRFLPFKDGTPGHDQSGILFSRLDMEAFQRCFITWVASLHETPEGVVAIDGKTLRRSFDTRSPEAPIHMISAWPCDHQLVPGQRKIDDRSNEITAIPELLALLALKGAIVTIDAIGCQRKICQQIMDQEAGYVIGLKGNQGSLREDVELFFDEHPERDTGAKFIEKSEAADAGHGRIETRCCTVCSNTEPNATNGRA